MRDLVVPSVIVAGMSLVPLIAIRYISQRYFDFARDTWMLGLALIGALLVGVFVSLPLGLMSAVAVYHWRSWQQLPAVLTWAAIVATWILTQSFSSIVRDWVPLGWR